MKKLLSCVLTVIILASLMIIPVNAETELSLIEFNINSVKRDIEDYYYESEYTNEVIINHVIYARKTFERDNTIANYYTVVSWFDSQEAVDTVTEINIESEINGLPVLSIEIDYNFIDFYMQENTKLEKITLPDTLRGIGVLSFDFFTKVKELILPESLEYIGDYAFSGMTSLEKITFPKKIDIIYEGVLSACTNLKKVEFKGKIKEIRDYAFSRCKNLNSITTPKSLEKIWEYAFKECGIKRANINFKNIKKKRDRFNYRYFGLDEGYTFYKNKRLKRLTITTNRMAIGEEDIYKAKNLKWVKIDSKYVRFGSSVFRKCKNLKSIKLTAKYAEISKDAFKKIPKACKIYVKNARVKKAIVNSGFKGKVLIKKNMK